MYKNKHNNKKVKENVKMINNPKKFKEKLQ